MDFKQEYIEEVKQILKNLEKSIMLLDQEPNQPDEINNIYRYLHTVKGSAGMFDFKDMERLTHELENVYTDIRDGIRTIDEYVLDLTLHAIDILNDLIEGSVDSGPTDKIIESIITLRGQEASLESSQSLTANNNKKEAFSIFFRPTETLFKRGINVSAMLEDLEDLTWHEIIIHNESVPFEKQLADQKFVSWLEILAVSEEGREAVDDVFLFLNDQDFQVLKLESKESFTNEEYKKQVVLNDDEVEFRLGKLESFDAEIFNKQAQQEKTNKSAILQEVKHELQELQEEEEQVETIAIKKSSKKSAHINVSTDKLDDLINIVSELVTFRSEMQHLLSDEKDNEITEAVEKLEFLTLRLRDSAFNIRLVPINILQVKLQRLIRTVSKDLNKEIEFITEGLDTELDRSIITALEAPLMHIIRNSLDHGIESPDERESRNKPRKGLLKLYSYNSGDHVFIQIQDDGNGIDFEKIKKKAIEKGLIKAKQECTEQELINIMMSPGFSTADEVTKVSGRGVGMDVVKKEIESLRGDIDISTEDGLGTIITLRLPLTLTILDTLVVKVSEEKYLIPINEIEYCYEEDHAVLFKNNRRLINYDNVFIPFVSLRNHFGHEEHPEKETVIIVKKNDVRIAVVVDDIIGQYQTVYKPLNELIQDIDCFSGASILGDGTTALILNALKLKN
ncbi:chemotaxis protein CheA [Marivirga arenosa]|uniref:Chemotaxis protein CheA n=1 Tax=Marivirga arenosa TaxID=3059076 RepID=A0AA51ZWI0_9BACT|nr:chemotaxis protein CheA [Marivirga sp. BKB1-2]WNB18029.1 chemotaxis protein CheA [Marivirga sp. BKB1-2]